MATTNQPFGLLARWHPSGQARSNAYENVLLSGQTTNIYYGTPVMLVPGSGSATLTVTGGTLPIGTTAGSGQMVLIPVTTNAAAVLGSFAGCEYTDLNGRRQYSKFWTSGLTTYAGTQVLAYVFDDPENVYEIAFDGALNTTGNLYQFYGKQASFNSADLGFTSGTSLLPAGNAVPIGQSAQRASATLTSTGSQGQLMIVNSFGLSSSTTQISDAFPTQYVKVARHQLRNPQTSL